MINESAVGFPNNTRAALREYGEIQPGRTNTGYGLSPETKKELEGVLVETTKQLKESLFARIRPKEKETKGYNLKWLNPFNSDSSDATSASQADAKRQQLITVGLGIIGIIAIVYAARKAR